MSLAKQIAARMLAKKSAAQESISRPAPVAAKPAKQAEHYKIVMISEAVRVVSPPARHTSPQAYNPPKVSRAEKRVRQSLGAVSRNAPEPAQPVSTQLEPAQPETPVRTSALPAAPAGPRTITERPPALPPVPPRAELELDLVKGLQALPLPASPANSAPAPTGRGRGSCFAIDAETGRQCRLPAHPESPDRHRHERGPFFRLLQAGAVPRLRELLDSASTRAINTEVYNGASHVKGEHVATSARPALKTSIRRNKAHAGEPVTEDHTSRENEKRAETGGGDLNFSGLLIDANGVAYHRAGVILPNGELLDDLTDALTTNPEVS